MMKPSRFAGQRSQPACFHRQGRAWRFLGKIILAALRYFSRKPCLWRRTARKPPKTGMAFPLKHEDYESKRTHQKDSGQQMGKNPRAGRHGSRHFQLDLYTRHISRMDCRSHHLFQGILQVPLPCSLPARGTGHPPVHPEFSGLLKSDSMEHTRILSLQHKGAVRKTGGSFYIRHTRKRYTRKRERTENTDIGTPENYRAKLANASCRTARSGRKRFRKKSSSLRSGIFPENPAFPEAFAVGPL